MGPPVDGMDRDVILDVGIEGGGGVETRARVVDAGVLGLVGVCIDRRIEMGACVVDAGIHGHAGIERGSRIETGARVVDVGVKDHARIDRDGSVGDGQPVLGRERASTRRRGGGERSHVQGMKGRGIQGDWT